MKQSPTIHRGLTALVALCVGMGCSDTSSPPPTAVPPALTLSAVPAPGSAPYAVRLGWSGTDADGVVVEYRYAVNPSAEFSEEDIAGRTPLEEVFIPGVHGLPDRTRVTKTLDDHTATFDWVHTTRTDVELNLDTPNPDDTTDPPTRFTGLHAVYVIAMDNDGLRSDPAHAALSVSTVVARSSIQLPVVGPEAITVGRDLILVPRGTDDDNPDGPAAYEYKVVSFENPQWLQGPEIPEFVRTQLGATENWFRVDARQPTIRIALEERLAHYIAVRALDAAGPREPFLELGRNVMRCRVNGLLTGPRITLSESLLGSIALSSGQAISTTIPAGTALRFTVNCDASAYAGQCEGIRWGLDLDDPEADAGWSPWSAHSVLPQVRFLEPGTHTVHVEARDVAGRISRGVFPFEAMEFGFEHPVLFVDDSRDDNFPLDSSVDGFWRGLFDHSQPSIPFEQFAVHGPDDRNTTVYGPPLETMGKYRLLIWDLLGTGYAGLSGFLQRATLSAELGLYLRAGGQLWMDGRLVMTAAQLGPSKTIGEFNYPKSVASDTFAWSFLKLFTTKVDNDQGADSDNALWEAMPIGEPGIYPRLEVSREPRKLNRVQDATGGITRSDAVFDPIRTSTVDGFAGTLDSLYAYGAAGPLRFGTNSPYHGRLMGTRWHDPDPNREHGRVQWFGFPLYFFKDDQAQELFDQTLDWFREEVPPALTSARRYE